MFRYNIFIHVLDTLTGQSELSSNHVTLRYDLPRISTTNILQTAGANQVKISGVNFCADNNCGELFVCVGVNANETVGGCQACFTGPIPQLPTDPPQQIANTQNPPLGTTELWSHKFARVLTTRSGGCVYIRVGDAPDNYVYSNAVSFTTTNPLILQGGDLPDKTADFITRTAAYPTSALDANNVPIRLKLLVANLQNPGLSNMEIKIGPYSCAQEQGTALLTGAPTEMSTGHEVTVLLPEGTGTDIQVKVCFYGKASAPAIIHYLPPVVQSVRHLPYAATGADDIDLTSRNGGLPTGGAAYNGFTPSQMDSAIAAATARVTAAATNRDAAQVTLNGLNSQVLSQTGDVETCENSSDDPPKNANGELCDISELENALSLKVNEATLAETELMAQQRTYTATVAEKNGLSAAKTTPYTYQHFELLGNNFGSESLASTFPDLTFRVLFSHVDPLVNDPIPKGMGYEVILRNKESGSVVNTCLAGGFFPCCPVWTHSRLVCKVPAGTGKGWLFKITVGNQATQWPTIPKSIPFHIPTMSSILPLQKPTTGFTMSIAGRNFGAGNDMPIVQWGEGENAIKCPIQTFQHDQITCFAPSGQGKDLPLYVLNGPGLVVPAKDVNSPWAGIGDQYARKSDAFMFSYDAPTIQNMDKTSGTTSGLSSENNSPLVITITGNNFGTSENSDIEVRFYPGAGEDRTAPFVSSVAMILSHDHTTIVFQQPPGYSRGCTIRVVVAGRESAVGPLTFDYNVPVVTNIRPFCGGKKISGKGVGQYLEGECYGTVATAFSHPEQYPRIVSITTNDAIEQATMVYDVSTMSTKEGTIYDLSLAAGDVVRVVGMPTRAFNRQWRLVSGVSSAATADAPNRKSVLFSYDKNKDKLPTPNTASLGASSSRLSKPYVRGASNTFRVLESDGCGAIVEYTSNAGYIRSSGWEPYSTYKDRRNRAGEAASSVKRECVVGNLDRRQRIFVEGMDLAALAPASLILERKVCDCVTALDGTTTPCRDLSTSVCRGYAGGVSGTCPANHEDCAINTEWVTMMAEDEKTITNGNRRLAGSNSNNGMVVEEHTDTRIVVLSRRGYGRHLRLKLTVGNYAVPVSSSMALRYQPPTVRAFETLEAQQGGATSFRPGDVVALLGYNFGFGGVGTSSIDLQKMLTVRLGSQYDASGNDCATSTNCELDKTYKICQQLTYHPEYLVGSKSSYRGFPYLTCKTVPDVAGRKNWSLSFNGEEDSCASNSFLCADADDWPVYRTTSNPNRAVNITDELNDRTKGPLFTCGKQSQQNQAYANTGELCVNISETTDSAGLSARCEDSECTSPRALAGFWRLDLDLKFACNAGLDNIPTVDQDGAVLVAIAGEEQQPLSCQNPVEKGAFDLSADDATVAEKAIGYLNPSSTKTKSGASLCVAPNLNTDTLSLTCPEPTTQLRCDLRGAAAPEAGKCVFRRAKEARRAMGKAYTPWASEAQVETVEKLTARCSSARYLHLTDPAVYDEYPQLKISPICYDVVGCSPKDSCRGNNTCNDGYEYQKYSCQKWNNDNPDQLSCQSDDDCRSRSGKTAVGGFGSACDKEHPEDCSRCNLGPIDVLSGTRNGTCECTGGAPRCGLCTQAVSYSEDDVDVNGTRMIDVKGFFRLNNECQECPENPELILWLLAVAVVLMCIAGWWAQSRKINISVLSIGVDYFQVLSIFAGLRVRWPTWVKRVLEIISIFNFNIDIAAPECAIPDFDYETKWIITVLLPAIFGSVLFLIFLTVMLVKCIKQYGVCASKGTKYTSHGSKLLASFVLVFYFLYLAVTRRALDVFNCNPVVPDDGYLYTEFTSIACEAGLCRCNDPDELQQKLVPYAIACVAFYSIGFPIYVLYVTWYYRIQIKLDQLLRAHDLGEDRATSPDSGDVLFTPRTCRSKSKLFYDIRKRHHQLYYHFKPGKVYWLAVILLRKFLIAMIALLFRSNIIFMLATMLLVLFANYVLTAKHRPYMSTVEREKVKEAHRLKVEEAQAFIDADVHHEDIPKESLLHFQLDPAIRRLVGKRVEKTRRLGHKHIRNLSHAKNIHLARSPTVQYYFDYNTVEIVLIGSSIFLS